MSLQQGLNQLLGGASALLSLNPQVQAGGAEQSELRKLNRQEKGFEKQVKSATPVLAENKAKIEEVQELMENREGLSSGQIEELREQYVESSSKSKALENQLKSFENQGAKIATDKFNLRPTVANFQNMIDWKSAAYREAANERFRQLGQNSVEQNARFKELQESLHKENEDFSRLGKYAQDYITKQLLKEDK